MLYYLKAVSLFVFIFLTTVSPFCFSQSTQNLTINSNIILKNNSDKANKRVTNQKSNATPSIIRIQKISPNELHLLKDKTDKSKLRGGSNGAGGNSIEGKLVEAYGKFAVQLPEYKELIEPKIKELHKHAPLFAKRFETFASRIIFYVVPKKFRELSESRTGLPFSSDQVATQCHGEVFVDSEIYNGNSSNSFASDQRAILLAHELVLGMIENFGNIPVTGSYPAYDETLGLPSAQCKNLNDQVHARARKTALFLLNGNFNEAPTYLRDTGWGTLSMSIEEYTTSARQHMNPVSTSAQQVEKYNQILNEFQNRILPLCRELPYPHQSKEMFEVQITRVKRKVNSTRTEMIDEVSYSINDKYELMKSMASEYISLLYKYGFITTYKLPKNLFINSVPQKLDPAVTEKLRENFISNLQKIYDGYILHSYAAEGDVLTDREYSGYERESQLGHDGESRRLEDLKKVCEAIDTF